MHEVVAVQVAIMALVIAGIVASLLRRVPLRLRHMVVDGAMGVAMFDHVVTSVTLLPGIVWTLLLLVLAPVPVLGRNREARLLELHHSLSFVLMAALMAPMAIPGVTDGMGAGAAATPAHHAPGDVLQVFIWAVFAGVTFLSARLLAQSWGAERRSWAGVVEAVASWAAMGAMVVLGLLH